ncbi:hypothetical protein HSB1_38870 [Halogranum salarium B-1]|uniref:Uncharacterized protein n=1 Tax=Halogranum salarium B-1 TaxID=1210908 RepID=J3EU40_9EURY|nr:hypothetical protein HSB1_38870 [Halogranum salarium B-1]
MRAALTDLEIQYSEGTKSHEVSFHTFPQLDEAPTPTDIPVSDSVPVR